MRKGNIMYEQEVQKLQEIIDDSQNIVFFGGAGVSTESNIPDFRSADGLYHQAYKYSPEQVVSHSFFMRYPDAFYEFYKDKMMLLDAKPNPAHMKLAELEAAGKLSAIVTQNIDGLHKMAGNKRVYELHGSVCENYCVDCDAEYPVEKILESEGVPRCDRCGGIIKPWVVLYGEAPDKYTGIGALREISGADTLIVAGTSLQVEPAASYIDHFTGRNLIVINREPTPADERATLVLHGDIEEIITAAFGV
jgi:NAD-dependent deacetylase